MGTNTFFLNLPAHLYLCATVKSRSFLTDLRVEGKVENSLHNCKTQIKMESKSRIFQNKVTFQGYYKTRKLFHILYVTVFSGYKTSGAIFLKIYFFSPFFTSFEVSASRIPRWRTKNSNFQTRRYPKYINRLSDN